VKKHCTYQIDLARSLARPERRLRTTTTCPLENNAHIEVHGAQ
jgi:hypothetical protein